MRWTNPEPFTTCNAEYYDGSIYIWSASILLAICFGYVLGDTLSKLVIIVSDIVRGIKLRRHTKTGK